MALGTAALPHPTLRADEGQRPHHQDEGAASSPPPQDFPWHPDKAQAAMALDNYPQTVCLDLQQRGHLQPASRESVPGTWENQWRLLEACLGSSSEMFPKR